MPAYGKNPTFVRKDALTPGRYGRMRDNTRYVQSQFRQEHLELQGPGLHNTPLIARTLGTVKLNAGVWTIPGFNNDVTLVGGAGVYNPVTGKMILTLASSRGYDPTTSVILAQNASVTGSSVPCFTDARFLDATHIEVFTYKWNAALGAVGSWLQENASSFVGCHTVAIDAGVPVDVGAPLFQGAGLRAADEVSYWNQFVQLNASLQSAYELGHRDSYVAGSHNLQEVPRSWAHVQFNGATTYSILESFNDDGQTQITSVTRSSAGQLVVNTTGGIAGTMEVFVECDYARQVGGTSSADLFMACVPNEAGGSWPDSFPVYLYKRGVSGIDDIWNRGDCDFYIWICSGPQP